MAAEQLAFLARTIQRANAEHLGVIILGHENPAGSAWLGDYFVQYLRIVQQTKTLVAQLWGHQHTDWWSLTRECAAPKHGGPPARDECSGRAFGVILNGPASTRAFCHSASLYSRLYGESL